MKSRQEMEGILKRREPHWVTSMRALRALTSLSSTGQLKLSEIMESMAARMAMY